MIDVLFVDRQAILAPTALMCSITAAMNMATLDKTAPTGFLPQEHHATQTGLIPGHDTTTCKGTDQKSTHYRYRNGRHSTDHNHTINTTVTGAVEVTEGTHHAPHPDITVACATLPPTDVLISTHTMTYPTDVVALHLKHAYFFHQHHSCHYATHNSQSHSSSSHPSAQGPQPVKRAKLHP